MRRWIAGGEDRSQSFKSQSFRVSTDGQEEERKKDATEQGSSGRSKRRAYCLPEAKSQKPEAKS
jgi:hypothetical protein